MRLHVSFLVKFLPLIILLTIRSAINAEALLVPYNISSDRCYTYVKIYQSLKTAGNDSVIIVVLQHMIRGLLQVLVDLKVCEGIVECLKT